MYVLDTVLNSSEYLVIFRHSLLGLSCHVKRTKIDEKKKKAADEVLI